MLVQVIPDDYVGRNVYIRMSHDAQSAGLVSVDKCLSTLMDTSSWIGDF